MYHYLQYLISKKLIFVSSGKPLKRAEYSFYPLLSLAFTPAAINSRLSFPFWWWNIKQEITRFCHERFFKAVWRITALFCSLSLSRVTHAFILLCCRAVPAGRGPAVSHPPQLWLRVHQVWRRPACRQETEALSQLPGKPAQPFSNFLFVFLSLKFNETRNRNAIKCFGSDWFQCGSGF